jgi:hypothetical protein
VTTGRELARGEYFILEPEVAQSVLDQLHHRSFRHFFPFLVGVPARVLAKAGL